VEIKERTCAVNDEKSYHINLDTKFSGLELIDVPSLVATANGRTRPSAR
jgi:hypothetical protein